MKRRAVVEVLGVLALIAGCAPSASEGPWYPCVLTRAPDHLPDRTVTCRCNDVKMECRDNRDDKA